MDQQCATSGCDSPVTIEGFLVAYGGAVILPLAVIEGPIVSVVTGLLTERGFFHWYWALTLLVTGDLLGDLGYYWLGRTAGNPVVVLGRRFGLRVAPGPELQRKLSGDATRMMLIGKWTHTLGFLVLTGCGALRVPLPKFLLVNLAATIPKTGVLFAVGYFAAGYIPLLERHAVLAAVVLCVIGGVAIVWSNMRAGVPRASQ